MDSVAQQMGWWKGSAKKKENYAFLYSKRVNKKGPVLQ
jgi:hypothetical protein